MIPSSPVTGILTAAPGLTQDLASFLQVLPESSWPRAHAYLLSSPLGFSAKPQARATSLLMDVQPGNRTELIPPESQLWPTAGGGTDPELLEASFPLSSHGWTEQRHIPAAIQVTTLIEKLVTCGHGRATVDLWTALLPSLPHRLSLIPSLGSNPQFALVSGFPFLQTAVRTTLIKSS